VPATHANVEHRTLNVQHRIRYSVNLKKSLSKPTPPKWLRRPGANLSFEILLFSILRFVCFKIDKAQRHQYSMFDVGRSMFDVQSVHYPGQAEFHTKFNIRFQDLANRLPDTQHLLLPLWPFSDFFGLGIQFFP